LRFIQHCLGRGTVEDAEEVFNDTLLAIWRDVGEYDPQQARFRTWVFFKARWAALDRRRVLTRDEETGPLPELAAAEFSWPLLLQLDLVLALEELGALDRQIVYLSDYLGWEHREIAGRLGLKVGALDTRLHRARRRLRRALAAWRPRQMREVGHE
jgi:RNA polymerase sigma factor (sigma-70 family)